MHASLLKLFRQALIGLSTYDISFWIVRRNGFLFPENILDMRSSERNYDLKRMIAEKVHHVHIETGSLIDGSKYEASKKNLREIGRAHV